MQVFLFGFIAAIALSFVLGDEHEYGAYTFAIGFVAGIFLVLATRMFVSFPEFKRLDSNRYPADDEWSRKLTPTQFLVLFITQTIIFLCVHFGWMIYLDWEIPSW